MVYKNDTYAKVGIIRHLSLSYWYINMSMYLVHSDDIFK